MTRKQVIQAQIDEMRDKISDWKFHIFRISKAMDEIADKSDVETHRELHDLAMELRMVVGYAY